MKGFVAAIVIAVIVSLGVGVGIVYVKEAPVRVAKQRARDFSRIEYTSQFPPSPIDSYPVVIWADAVTPVGDRQLDHTEFAFEQGHPSRNIAAQVNKGERVRVEYSDVKVYPGRPDSWMSYLTLRPRGADVSTR